MVQKIDKDKLKGLIKESVMKTLNENEEFQLQMEYVEGLKRERQALEENYGNLKQQVYLLQEEVEYLSKTTQQLNSLLQGFAGWYQKTVSPNLHGQMNNLR